MPYEDDETENPQLRKEWRRQVDRDLQRLHDAYSQLSADFREFKEAMRRNSEVITEMRIKFEGMTVRTGVITTISTLIGSAVAAFVVKLFFHG